MATSPLAPSRPAPAVPRLLGRPADASAGIARRPATRALGLGLALLALAGVLLASVAVGAKGIAPGVVLDALLRPDPAVEDHVIVQDLRLPRTALGLLVGVALGLAGAVMQGLTRNPLADPGLLGVNAGAAFAVVLAIHLLGIASPLGYVWFAFAGAAVAAVLVYALSATGREGATPVKLALAGAAVSALLASATTAVLLLDVRTLDQFRFWAVGSLAGREGAVALQLAPFAVAGAVVALACARVLDALALGEDVARALGQRVGAARAACALAVVLLVGAATAAAGPIAFVGLTVPHVARAICGPGHRWLLPYSAVLAPVLLLGADVLGRVVASPGELQVGIVTALIGGPVFVALVRRRRLAGL